MDPWTLFNQFSQYIDWLVVIVVLILTEAVKRLIPSGGVIGTPDVPKWIGRLMPFLPLFLGVGSILVKEACVPTGAILIKGFVSGGAAAYLYRTYKVTILGE